MAQIANKCKNIQSGLLNLALLIRQERRKMHSVSSAEATFDQFELRIELTNSAGQNLIKQSVFINRNNIAPENPIDLRQLAKSCQLSGEFFIVTCGCGEAGCAGIDDGIRVTHFDDRIIWEIPNPLSYRGMAQEEVEFVNENRIYKKYTIEPVAYIATFQQGLAAARTLLNGDKQPVECTPYGFDPSDLLELDPIVFSERGAPLGCKIVASKVQICRDPNWVIMNGIHYRLRDLPVPPEIKALADWSEYEPKKCGNGYLFNSAAAPIEEVERRVEVLEKYLASIRVH